jgi:hypothetical protein
MGATWGVVVGEPDPLIRFAAGFIATSRPCSWDQALIEARQMLADDSTERRRELRKRIVRSLFGSL